MARLYSWQSWRKWLIWGVVDKIAKCNLQLTAKIQCSDLLQKADFGLSVCVTLGCVAHLYGTNQPFQMASTIRFLPKKPQINRLNSIAIRC